MWTVLYASWALAMPLLIIAGALFWYAQAPEGRTGKGFGEWSRLLSMEFIGEVLLLALVGATFLYMLWDSQSWGTGAWLLPRIAIAFGMPLWVWRVASLFRQGMSDEGGQIMDTGFLDIEDSPAVVAGRWAQLVGTTGALLAGRMGARFPRRHTRLHHRLPHRLRENGVVLDDPGVPRSSWPSSCTSTATSCRPSGTSPSGSTGSAYGRGGRTC